MPLNVEVSPSNLISGSSLEEFLGSYFELKLEQIIRDLQHSWASDAVDLVIWSSSLRCAAGYSPSVP
jgi:hypothetical protein